MSKSLNPIRPLFVLALIGALAAFASGCGTTTASVDRGRDPVHPELRHLPPVGAGRDDRPGRAEPRRRLRRRPRGGGGELDDRRESSSHRSRTRGRATAIRSSRCPPTSSAGRTSRTSPPTSASTPACRVPPLPRCPAALGPRSSPTTAAAAATRSGRGEQRRRHRPRPRQGRPDTEPGGGPRGDRRPEQDDRQGLSAERDAAELRDHDQLGGDQPAGPVSDRLHRQGRLGPGAPGRPARLGKIRSVMRKRLEISPRQYQTGGDRRPLLPLARSSSPAPRCASPAPASAARTGPSATAERCRRSTPTP